MNNELTTFHARDESERAHATHTFRFNPIQLTFFSLLLTESLLIQRLMLVLSKQQISWDICLICIYLMRIFAKAFLTHIHTDGFTLHLIKSSPGKLLFLCIYIYICMLSLGLFNLAVNLNCLLLYFSDSVIRAHITRFVCK